MIHRNSVRLTSLLHEFKTLINVAGDLEGIAGGELLPRSKHILIIYEKESMFSHKDKKI